MHEQDERREHNSISLQVEIIRVVSEDESQDALEREDSVVRCAQVVEYFEGLRHEARPFEAEERVGC